MRFRKIDFDNLDVCVSTKTTSGRVRQCNALRVVRLSARAAFFCALVASNFTGCALSKKALSLFQDPQIEAVQADSPRAYVTGLELLKSKFYERALRQFENFLRDEPASRYAQVANFNSARSLEGLERWEEATERYRGVIKMTQITAPRLQALALYRISFCHEALGDDTAAVATLVDAFNRKLDLPKEIADAELPARLAAGYARVGNFDRALQFYQLAEKGILQLRRGAVAKAGEVPEWLPRTLYFMGRVTLRKASWDDFETALRPVARAQVYLLEAAEMQNGEWSDKAAGELINVYRDLLSAIQFPPGGVHAPVPGSISARAKVDEDLAAQQASEELLLRRKLQAKQWVYAELVLGTIEELHHYRSPEVRLQTASVKEIFLVVDKIEKDLRLLLNQSQAGTELTPEAQARKNSIRGRVLEPDQSLEKKAADEGGVRTAPPSARLPEKKSSKKRIENAPKELPDDKKEEN